MVCLTGNRHGVFPLWQSPDGRGHAGFGLWPNRIRAGGSTLHRAPDAGADVKGSRSARCLNAQRIRLQRVSKNSGDSRCCEALRLGTSRAPTQPARCAVLESGGHLMMADGGNWGARAPRVWFVTPRRELREMFGARRVERQPGRLRCRDAATKSRQPPDGGAMRGSASGRIGFEPEARRCTARQGPTVRNGEHTRLACGVRRRAGCICGKCSQRDAANGNRDGRAPRHYFSDPHNAIVLLTADARRQN
jgi:hypothetical protein